MRPTGVTALNPFVESVKVVKQICQKRVRVDKQTEAYCPYGFSEVGAECVRERTFRPLLTCVETGRVTTLEEGCPPSVQRTAKIRRGTMTEIDPQVYCPTGFDSNGVRLIHSYRGK